MSGWKKKRRRRRDAKEEAGNQETKREEGRGEEKREQSGLFSFVHSFAIPISSRAPGKFLFAGMDVDVEIVRGVRMSPWLAAAWQEFPLDTPNRRELIIRQSTLHCLPPLQACHSHTLWNSKRVCATSPFSLPLPSIINHHRRDHHMATGIA